MTTSAPVGQQENYMSAHTAKILDAVLAVVDKLDDGEPLKTFMTKDEDMPSKLAHGLIVYYRDDSIEEIYLKLQKYLAEDHSELIGGIAWLLKPIIGPSKSDREHTHKRISKLIADCLERISAVAIVPLESFRYWEDVAFTLETTAYDEALDTSEYTEATEKIEMVLRHCNKTGPQHEDDMKSWLLEVNCVDDDFWKHMDGKSTEDASEEEGDDDDDMDVSKQPEYGASPSSTSVISVELQQKSWSRIEKALRSCMGRFPYPERDDVQHKYYILKAREIENARFFAEQDIRLRHADSVSRYQASVESLITQINDWGELGLWEHWHDFVNQLLDRANEPAEYYPVNNEELNREEEELEKYEKLREKSESNQKGHLEAISGGKAYSSLQDEALVMGNEESAPFATVPPTTENESARAKSSKARLGDEKTDESRNLSDVQTRVEHSFQTQGEPTTTASHARPPPASPQLGQQPALGNFMETTTKEQAALILVALFQRFVGVLRKGSSGYDMLERVTPRTLALRISEKVFKTPETANEIVQSLVGRLNIILRDSGASGDDELIAELRMDQEWLRPSRKERREASRKMRSNIKQCNARMPTAEALTIPQIKEVIRDVESPLVEKAIDFIEYKNMCDAVARDANQCFHRLPDNIDSWHHLLLTYLPEDHHLRPVTTPLAPREQALSVNVSKEHSNHAQAATCHVPSTGSKDPASSPSTPLDQDMDVDAAVIPSAFSTQGVRAYKHTATSGVSITIPMVAPPVYDSMDIDEAIASAEHYPSNSPSSIYGKLDVDTVNGLDETREPGQVSTTRGKTTNESHSTVYLPQLGAPQREQSHDAGSKTEPTNNFLNLSASPNVTASGSSTFAQSEPVPTVAQPWQPIPSTSRYPVTERGAAHIIRRREQRQSPMRERIRENRWSPLASRYRRRAARDASFRDELNVVIEQLSSFSLVDGEAAVCDASGSDTTESNTTENNATENNSTESNTIESDLNQMNQSDSSQGGSIQSDTPEMDAPEVDTPPSDAPERILPTSSSASDLLSPPIVVADSLGTAKLTADVQALNSRLESLEKTMSQRQRREIKRLRNAKKRSRRSHTRLQEEANLVGTRLDRLGRSQQEAYAYNEGLKRRDLEMTAREKEVTARENKVTAQQKEMVAREKEMVTLQKDMAARQKDMAALQKRLGEREQLASVRLQAIAEQAMALSHTPVSLSQQEITTASAKKLSQPRIAEHAMTISATLQASRNSTHSAPSAAQAALVPAILQHPQAPRSDLPPKAEVQKSNNDKLHSTSLRTLADRIPYTMSATWKNQLNSCQQTAVCYVDNFRKICARIRRPSSLTNRIRAWTAQELDKWVEKIAEIAVRYDVQKGVSQANYRLVMNYAKIAATVTQTVHDYWTVPCSAREDVWVQE